MPPIAKYEARSRYLVGIIAAELEITNKLTRSSWAKLTKVFNKKFSGGFAQSLLKHHFNRLELHYDILQQFRGQADFTLNEELGLVTADNAVWQEYLQFHPEALIVCGHRFPMFGTMKALNLTSPPGRRANEFHLELMKPKCNIREAIEHYTTLMNHEEMLSEVLGESLFVWYLLHFPFML
ncbi:hypothetical protein DFH28DRAFT_903147 [Melampsora americana]|nr:hypothetical protein DFH28DRAFT_903147 [Melampsora americana]